MKTSAASHEKADAKEKPKLSDKEIDALIVDRQKTNLKKFSASIVSIKGWLICSVVALLAVLLFPYLIDDFTYYRKVWFYAVAVVAALSAGGIFLWYVRVLIKIQERLLERQSVVTETNRLQEELEQDFFTNLVKINFKYIDKYYLQTQVQADRSFFLSCGASLFAFAVIVSGVVMLYLDKVQQGYVVAASGILGEFVASVFFYLYNRTVIKMGEYHQKLVLTQNISLALKIANDLPDEAQVDVKKHLIEYLSKDINVYLTRMPFENIQPVNSLRQEAVTDKARREKA